MNLREAAQQALEALERVMSHGQAVQEAKDTLRAALARDCPYTSDELRGAYYEGFLKGVAAEREECAKVLEKLEQEWEDAELWASFKTIGIAIDAIRSRTNPVK